MATCWVLRLRLCVQGGRSIALAVTGGGRSKPVFKPRHDRSESQRYPMRHIITGVRQLVQPFLLRVSCHQHCSNPHTCGSVSVPGQGMHVDFAAQNTYMPTRASAAAKSWASLHPAPPSDDLHPCRLPPCRPCLKLSHPSGASIRRSERLLSSQI